MLREWEEYQDRDIAEAVVFLASKVLRVGRSAGEGVMEIAWKLMGVWREN